MNKKNLNNKSLLAGQTMVEMVVAVGMVSLVLVAIVSSVALSVRNSRFSKNKAIATRYTQEAVEKFRRYRDEIGWEPFKTEIFGAGTSAVYCVPTLPADLATLVDPLEDYEGECVAEKILNSQSEDTEFMREVTLNLDVVDEKADVVVVVSWNDGSRSHDVTLDAQLYKWVL